MLRYKKAFLFMAKNLVIVESPAKAKTITGYLGPDYVVMSSIGHIRDLPAKDMNIDIANNFKPNYEVPAEKKKVVSELKKAVKSADKVWLASDEDREGEAIAWHLSEVLGLNKSQSKRIVFHEITKEAINNAIKNPRDIDLHLVDAQQARRILDRLVGYELSPVLWRKIRPGLSAGRVQSVAVRLIVEREREIESFEPIPTFKVVGNFIKDGIDLSAQLKDNLKNSKEAEEFLNHCTTATFTVSDVTKKPGERNPSPPFTTSTLQQEASRRLGFSVKQTMQVAQKLYENGHITYMRTDSMNLSTQSLKAIGEYINKSYGAKYAKTRAYKTKNSSAQEAHEAIRPTNVNRPEAGQDSAQQKLYQLIWKRTVASQMTPAQVEQTVISIAVSSHIQTFIAKGEVLIFDGFYKVYGGGKDDQILPDFVSGDKLTLKNLTATETFTKAPPRYSEASLVKALEDLGIGRPSTYAPTISTIQTRGYIVRGDVEGGERQITTLTLKDGKVVSTTDTEQLKTDKNKLAPTHLALVTTDFLVKQFESILDYGFTAKAEADLDAIAEGKAVWQEQMKYFYDLFHPLVIEAGEASRQEAAQARLIGNDPKSGEPVYARYGKYGPMLQKGDATDDKKPAFAPLPEATRIDTVTLEEALTMFTLPRTVGTTTDGQQITANIGRFGPYVQIGKLFVSIKPHSPFDITEDLARELYAKKLETDAKKDIKSFEKEGINVLNGPFGAYVTDGKKNARIPKNIEPKNITLKQAQELLAKAKAPKKRIARKKK
jgi:DNA topoisomerase-1